VLKGTFMRLCAGSVLGGAGRYMKSCMGLNQEIEEMDLMLRWLFHDVYGVHGWYRGKWKLFFSTSSSFV
jgi:hypothetical protein